MIAQFPHAIYFDFFPCYSLNPCLPWPTFVMTSTEATAGIQARLVPQAERKLQDKGFAACFMVFLVGACALGFNSVGNAASIGA